MDSKHPSIEKPLLAGNAITSVPGCVQGWLLCFCLLHYYLLIDSHAFLFFTLDSNQIDCSHAGGLVGSEHLLNAKAIESFPCCVQGWLLCF